MSNYTIENLIPATEGQGRIPAIKIGNIVFLIGNANTVGQLEAGVIDSNGNFQPLAFNGTQARDQGSAVQGLQPKIFNTGHAEPAEEPTEVELEAGVINADGNFQPLAFNGTQASDSGSAVQGLEPAIFNTGHEEPHYGDSSTDM